MAAFWLMKAEIEQALNHLKRWAPDEDCLSTNHLLDRMRDKELAKIKEFGE